MLVVACDCSTMTRRRHANDTRGPLMLATDRQLLGGANTLLEGVGTERRIKKGMMLVSCAALLCCIHHWNGLCRRKA